MLKPTLIIKDINELNAKYLEIKIDNHLVEVPLFNSKDTFLLNLTGSTQISNSEISDMFDAINLHALPALKSELFILAKRFLSKSDGFIFIDQNDGSQSSKLINSFAILSPNKRKSIRGYLLELEEHEQNEALNDFIERIISTPYWANHISSATFKLISAQALPALLLSNREEIATYSLKMLMERLNIIIITINSNVKKIDSKNPYLNNFDIDWLIFTRDHICTGTRRISSADRSLALATIRLGARSKLWIPTLPPEGGRLQGSIILPPDILRVMNDLYQIPSRTVVINAWTRFIYLSSGLDTKNIPIGLSILVKQALPKLSSKMGIPKIIRHINAISGINYPADMAVSFRKNRSLKWFEKIRVYKNEFEESIISTSEQLRKLGFVSFILPSEWYEFLKIYHEELNASDGHKKATAFKYLKWAIEEKGINSPWDVKPSDLISPTFSATNKLTFQEYVSDKVNVKHKKYLNWSSVIKMYTLVCNRYALMGRELASPFKHLPDPRFSGKKSTSKTHRKRISQSIIDKMIYILLAENEQGIPTYAWAKELSRNAIGTKANSRSDHYYDPAREKDVFCPSRAAALSLLILLPLRGVQVRWLDQGLADDEIFDVDKLEFVANLDQLRDFENEFGYTHEDIVGIPTGVIQKSINQVGTTDDYSIYVNSNKTKLWEPDEHNGYHIPWPYTKSPKNAAEVRLNRPYTVIFEQLRWMNKYSPKPFPLRFDHLSSDASRLTDSGNVKANTPFIVPLFRDLNTSISYELKNKFINAFAPISKEKLERLFNDLSAETEQQLRAEGYDIVLTKKNAKNETVSLFDIHSLRVAGISSLIERGVPVHIVSEFVAGHLSIVMTLRYLKQETAQIKETIIAANSKMSSGMEKLVDFSGDIHLIQPVATGNEDLILNRKVASFAPVDGGVCPLGGKGCDGCQKGMMVERNSNTRDELVMEYQQVIGGCGNCRFWMTGPDFIGEQVLDLNRLMLQMRESAKEVMQLNNAIEDLEWEQEDAEDADTKRSIAIRLMNLKSTIAGKEQELLPFMTAWSNKYIAIQESLEALKEAHQSGDNKLTLIGSDVQATLKSASEFELVRTIIEQARILPRSAVPIPESPARMLREFMDAVLANTGSQNLFASITDKQLATTGASQLANMLAEKLNEQDMDSLIAGDTNSISSELIEFVSKAAQDVSATLEKQNKNKRVIATKKDMLIKQLQEKKR